MPINPRLPQDDDMRRRRAELAEARKDYRYNYDLIPGLAMAEKVPGEQKPSFDWWKKLVPKLAALLRNNLINDLEDDTKVKVEAANSLEKGLGLGFLKDIMGMVDHVMDLLNRKPGDSPPGNSLQEYRDLFQTIEIPPVANNFMDDDLFTWLRVAGPTPILLERVAILPDHFPVSDRHLRALPGFQHDSLTAAGAEGRLYMVDFKIFHGIKDGAFPFGQKYAYAPMALFALPPGKGPRRMKPIAVQCEQTPGPHTPVITPLHGWAWQMAKTVVNMAAGNYHELIAHLGRTHLVVEPFVIATYRNLAANHPLSLLLRPHFEGTLYINCLAHKDLIPPKAGVDELLAATIEEDHRLVVSHVKNIRFNHLAQPVQIAQRGVDNPDLIYPYRDDSLVLWDAIKGWVDDYLTLYYPNDRIITEDTELQAWVDDLAARDGGRLRELGTDHRVRTRKELAALVTTVIFTASVQHTAVNFPQWDVMGFNPVMPLALYSIAPTRTEGYDEQDWLKMLPPLTSAELQMTLGYLLGTVHHTQLGEYGDDYFQDPRVAAPLATFKQALLEAEKNMIRRNRTAPIPYQTLHPPCIPQSINI
ncbi:MAG: lipoxygenase family protein [Acidobacteriota bacterium]|nr:lipoxygenase family protein [Acidobacteriota bacterium]